MTITKKTSNRPALLFIAALAGLPAMTAFGQNRINADGHLLDRNPRIGSGGINSSQDSSYRSQQNLGVDIATGNVSGLNYFHGRDDTFNPNVVQVNDGYQASENLTARSAPVNRTAPNTGQPNYVPVFQTGRADPSLVNAADNGQLRSTRNNALLLPAPRMDPLTPSTDVRTDPITLGARNGLQSQTDSSTVGPINNTAAPKAGDDPMYEFSPLYGVRQSDGAVFGSGAVHLQARASTDNSADLSRMRDELNQHPIDQNQSVGGANTTGANTSGADGGQKPAEVNSPGAINLNAGQGLTTPTLNNNGLTNAVANNQVDPMKTTTSIQTDQHYTNTLIIPAGQQSRQVAELIQKYGKTTTDAQSAKQFNELNTLKKAGEQKPTGLDAAQPDALGHGGPLDQGTGVPKPAVTPDRPKTEVVTTPAVHPEADNKPVVVTSLAAGIDAAGLAGLMRNAEGQMRDGKFSKASDLYDSAEQVAPNNPFVPLGRSFAELGGAYYVHADSDLARAVALEPAVLGGQYDLKGFLGEDRLKFVQKDLTDNFATEKTARAEVLLAFIAHNTGDDKGAATHLDIAASRGGEADLIASMRSVWKMPAKADASK